MTDTRQAKASRGNRIAIGVLIAVVSLFCFLSDVGALGGVGRMVYGFLVGFFGIASYAYSLAGIVVGVAIAFGLKRKQRLSRALYFFLLWLVGVFALHIYTSSGHIIGANYGEYLVNCYHGTNTAGGMLLGIPAFPLMKLMTGVGALAVASAAFLIMAFFGIFPTIRRNVTYTAVSSADRKRAEEEAPAGKAPRAFRRVRRDRGERIVASKEPTLTDFSTAREGASLYVVDVDGERTRSSRRKGAEGYRPLGSFDALYPNKRGGYEDEIINNPRPQQYAPPEPKLGTYATPADTAREILFGTGPSDENIERYNKTMANGKSLKPLTDFGATYNQPSRKEELLAKISGEGDSDGIRSDYISRHRAEESEEEDRIPADPTDFEDIKKAQLRKWSESMPPIYEADADTSPRSADVLKAEPVDNEKKELAKPTRTMPRVEDRTNSTVKAAINATSDSDVNVGMLGALNNARNSYEPAFARASRQAETPAPDAEAYSAPDMKAPASRQRGEEQRSVNDMKPSQPYSIVDDKPAANQAGARETYNSAAAGARGTYDAANRAGTREPYQATGASSLASSNNSASSAQNAQNTGYNSQNLGQNVQNPIQNTQNTVQNAQNGNAGQESRGADKPVPEFRPSAPGAELARSVNAQDGYVTPQNQNIMSGVGYMPSQNTKLPRAFAGQDESARKPAGDARPEPSAKQEGQTSRTTQARDALDVRRDSLFKQKVEAGSRKSDIPGAGGSKVIQPTIAQTIKQAEEKEKPRRPYVAPPISLLNPPVAEVDQNEDYEAKKEQLVRTLAFFGIESSVESVLVGPTFTMYMLQVEMKKGKSVSTILQYSNDIAMKMEVESVRILAPIPGKNAVGIEVPNKFRRTVNLSEVLQSKEFNNAKDPATFALGVDLYGDSYVAAVNDLPHVIIAGSTGAGKSCCINSLIVSVLYKATPDDVRFIMVDPKRVELSFYSGIPHLLMDEIICDADKAIKALTWAIDEHLRRMAVFSELKIQNIATYNDYCRKAGLPTIPRIFVIIDEFADLMATGKKSIEALIAKLASLARASGIHLIIATQRPSVDVISGTIRNNFPSRIAFRVSDSGSSKTILDTVGAENLLGKGDMLYHVGGSFKRIQGAFISNSEIVKVVDFVKANNDCYFDEQASNAILSSKPEKSEEDEPSKEDARNARLVSGIVEVLELGIELRETDGNSFSISYVQRRLGYGYQKAARLVDMVKDLGYIGQSERDPKKTVVTMTREELEEFKLSQQMGRKDDDIE